MFHLHFDQNCHDACQNILNLINSLVEGKSFSFFSVENILTIRILPDNPLAIIVISPEPRSRTEFHQL